MPALLLAEQLYLLVSKPEDGTVTALDYTRVKRCLQGALAWEMGRRQAVTYAEGQVSLGPQADAQEDDLAATYRHLREQKGPIPIKYMICRFDCAQGTLDNFFAQRLTRQGLMEEKTITRLLVFTSTVHPRTPEGGAQAEALQQEYRQALERLAREESTEGLSSATLVGLLLLATLGLLERALGKGLSLPKSAPRRLVEEGHVGRDLLAHFPQLAEDVDMGALALGALDFVLGDSDTRP